MDELQVLFGSLDLAQLKPQIVKDGENVTLPKEDEAREALRKEAEFYNLPGLSKMCAPYTSVSKDDKGFEVRPFCKGDVVQWKESAIEMYWKYFSASVSNVGLHKAVINYEDWIPLRQHMPYMKGKVTYAILDYLRDKDHFFPPSDENAREALRREAEFYKLNDLVLMCLPDVFAVGDVVKWKENAIESYWKFFAMF
ncbi:unnamed protein product [Cylicocyclus nassatus]|uniref:Uncharacterized protein n=1 Tax=Cylicocyclus nassatus TaxID=53992 RepID=A0AA36DP90_CYLNA|nr:unnamed protein product [Cylicocyclus nassatus]